MILKLWLCFIIFSFASIASSQTLAELFQRTDNLYDFADYEKAIVFSEKALKMAESDYGKKSNLYATALDKRARLYAIFGESYKAEAFYKQSLEIIKDNSGDKNNDYASVLLDLARLYSSILRNREIIFTGAGLRKSSLRC